MNIMDSMDIRGSFLVFGESGSGKTVLLERMVGSYSPVVVKGTNESKADVDVVRNGSVELKNELIGVSTPSLEYFNIKSSKITSSETPASKKCVRASLTLRELPSTSPDRDVDDALSDALFESWKKQNPPYPLMKRDLKEVLFNMFVDGLPLHHDIRGLIWVVKGNALISRTDYITTAVLEAAERIFGANSTYFGGYPMKAFSESCKVDLDRLYDRESMLYHWNVFNEILSITTTIPSFMGLPLMMVLNESPQIDADSVNLLISNLTQSVSRFCTSIRGHELRLEREITGLIEHVLSKKFNGGMQEIAKALRVPQLQEVLSEFNLLNNGNVGRFYPHGHHEWKITRGGGKQKWEDRKYFYAHDHTTEGLGLSASTSIINYTRGCVGNNVLNFHSGFKSTNNHRPETPHREKTKSSRQQHHHHQYHYYYEYLANEYGYDSPDYDQTYEPLSKDPDEFIIPPALSLCVMNLGNENTSAAVDKTKADVGKYMHFRNSGGIAYRDMTVCTSKKLRPINRYPCDLAECYLYNWMIDACVFFKEMEVSVNVILEGRS